jgi:ABC-type uncharacterized transport system substrate-binding protein
MDRRAFIGAMAGGLLAAPLAARAQPRVLIGWLSQGPHPFIASFRRGLRDLGYVEWKDVLIEERYAGGEPARLPQLAVELVKRGANVIVTSGSAAGLAVKTATTSIPIVSITTDLVAIGLVPSMGHPGGNVTGLSLMSVDLSVKWIELLRHAFPKIARIAVLGDQSAPGTAQARRLLEATEDQLGVRLIFLEAKNGGELEDAFAEAVKDRADGIVPLSSTIYAAEKRRIVALAAKHRLPTIYEHRDFVDAGGLMSYGPDLDQVFWRAAAYVDKILKGAKPGDLPVEQPTKFELVINIKTAKALGLTIPPSLLQRADQVLE